MLKKDLTMTDMGQNKQYKHKDNNNMLNKGNTMPMKINNFSLYLDSSSVEEEMYFINNNNSIFSFM
jgi:hypothetical protein